MLIAKSSVKHDGQLYKSGEVIENISEDQAQVLIDADVAMSAQSKSEAKRLQTLEGDSTETTEVEENKDPMEGVKPTVNWSKTRLLGYARAKSVEVDDTMTRSEIFELIQAGATDEEGEDSEEGGAIGGSQSPASTSTPTPQK